MICNVDTRNARSNEHFLTLAIERDGQWFTLARYHDWDWAERSPDALASFLGLSVEEVFPIRYDLRKYSKGETAALVGQVLKEPRERLSRSELIALAVSS